MRKTFALVILLAVIMLPCGSPCLADHKGGKGPAPAEQGLLPDGGMQIGSHDRCPVCGMFPAKRPKNAAAMALADGRVFYFCGNGCLLRTWRNSGKYLGVASETIARMRVYDYFSGESIDARTAWWVAGSDVVGPMGPAIVALKHKGHVETFKKRHGGRHVFQLDQIDDTLWGQLFSGKKK